jgi:hypothetical protein
MTKSVQVIAVPHPLQGPGFPGYVEDESYSDWVESFIRNGADFVFEEAAGRKPSIAQQFADSFLGSGHYLDIDPSREERPKFGLAKDSGGGGPIDPMRSTDIYEQSDVDQQKKREELWQKRIEGQTFTKGLVICGLAHALSVAFRLRAPGVEVEVYTYIPYGKLCPRQHRQDNEVPCQVSVSFDEIHLEMIVPDAIFKATLKKPTSCTLSTKSGDTRRASLVFD